MFDFYYWHLKANYDNSIRMLYTDTDSLIVHVETEDVYADMLLDSDLYDTSNYPAEHPLYSTANKELSCWQVQRRTGWKNHDGGHRSAQ